MMFSALSATTPFLACSLLSDGSTSTSISWLIPAPAGGGKGAGGSKMQHRARMPCVIVLIHHHGRATGKKNGTLTRWAHHTPRAQKLPSRLPHGRVARNCLDCVCFPPWWPRIRPGRTCSGTAPLIGAKLATQESLLEVTPAYHSALFSTDVSRVVKPCTIGNRRPLPLPLRV